MKLRQAVRKQLRTVLVCAVLEFGAMIGLPMRPEEIEALMRTMNLPKVAHTLPEESENGDANLES
jgi:hypothetical protein